MDHSQNTNYNGGVHNQHNHIYVIENCTQQLEQFNLSYAGNRLIRSIAALTSWKPVSGGGIIRLRLLLVEATPILAKCPRNNSAINRR